MKREFSRSRSLNEIVTFVSGFCFLQFELLLGRILSPFFGSSTVTWSYLIASVLVGFALGTWSAGQSVDQLQPEQLQKKVSNHFFLLSILFLSYAFAIVPILTFVTDYFGFNEVTSIFSHVVLGIPPVFIIGRLSPMIFKSAKEIGSHPGKAISKYWLINTAGGLFGIFSLNFLLIAWLNLTTLQILTILAALCLLAAARARWHFFLALLVAALIPFQSSTGALHFETVFGSFYLREKVMQLGSFGSHLVRVLKFSQNRVSAGVILDTEHKTDLMFYNFDMRWAWAMNPNIRKVLILGFGSGAFARDLKKDAPDLDVTIVDLDAKLKDVAHDYFFYPKEPNDIEEVFDDARFFLQKSKFFYDLIIFDIYDSLGHPPTNSVSLEFFNLVRSRLSSSGIFAMNLFAAKPTNEHMTISGSVLRTMQEAFGVKPTTLLPIWRWTELAPFRDGRKENLLVFMISDFIVDKMDFDSIYTRFPNLNKNLNQFNGSIWENLAIEMQYGDHPVLVDQKNPSDMFEKNISLFNGVN